MTPAPTPAITPPIWPRRPDRRRIATLRAQRLAVELGVVALAAACMLAAADAGGAVLALVAALAAVALLAGRIAHARRVRRLAAQGRLATHLAVFGDGVLADHVERQLGTGCPAESRLVGRYAAQPGEARGGLAALRCDCRLGIVDTVILAPGPEQDAGAMLASLVGCAPEIFLAVTDGAAARAIGPVPVRRLGGRPIRGPAGVAKRVIDVAGAAALLILAAPALALIAALIKLETPGPVLFRQMREGYGGALFPIYKFRSMRLDATDRAARQQTVRGDRRVTRVGWIIRRLSLDELPQLLNVLRGEMSLVGPRPHAPGTSVGGRRIHTLVAGYDRRHQVRPGLTGLAQMRGLRGGLHAPADVQARLAADVEYIERWSLRLDLQIMLGTLLAEFRGQHGC